MMYPNLIRQNDSMTLPVPELKRFNVRYLVIDSYGDKHIGHGTVKSVDLNEANIYAMHLLQSFAPECAGYTGHAVKVSETEN